jgi:beta-phosphoglucomutase
MKAVIFDLDGVLVNSEPAQGQASRELFAKYGRKYTKVHEREFLGVRVRDEVARLKRRWGLKPTVEVLLAQRRQILERLVGGLELMPGAKELLRWLDKRQIPMGLGTSSETGYVGRVMDKFGIRQYFAAVVTGDDVIRGKPDPEVYLKVAKKLGIEPAECLVLEDAPNGAAAAKAAGMMCWMVRKGQIIEVRRKLKLTPEKR